MRCITSALSVLSLALVLRAAPTPQEMPQVKTKVEPAYPVALRKAGIEGQAFVRVTVNESGGIENADLMRATHPEFGAAAVEAVKKWTFTPASKDGHPVKTEVIIPFKFSLADENKTHPGDLMLLRGMVDSLLQGNTPGGILSHVDLEAYIVIGSRYEHLAGLLGDAKKLALLSEGPATKVLYSHLKTNAPEDAAYLVMRTKPASRNAERFHTIVMMKTETGIWKIASWHTSAL